jgi:hypothetical protein
MNVEEFRTLVKGGVEEKKSDFIKTESLVKEKIYTATSIRIIETKFGKKLASNLEGQVHIPKQNTGCI